MNDVVAHGKGGDGPVGNNHNRYVSPPPIKPGYQGGGIAKINVAAPAINSGGH